MGSCFQFDPDVDGHQLKIDALEYRLKTYIRNNVVEKGKDLASLEVNKDKTKDEDKPEKDEDPGQDPKWYNGWEWPNPGDLAAFVKGKSNGKGQAKGNRQRRWHMPRLQAARALRPGLVALPEGWQQRCRRISQRKGQGQER